MIGWAPFRGLAFLLAFTAGYVDTVGYVGLFGLFTAHVTGNLVLIGASIGQAHSGLLAKLLALPVFILVAAATSLFLQRSAARRCDPTFGLLGAQTIFLTAFMAFAVRASPILSGDQPLAVLAGLVGVAAMAIQNVASRTALAELAPTTVMTGNVTQLVLDLMALTYVPVDRTAVVTRIKKTAPPLFGFSVGAIAGGLIFSEFGFWCLAPPIACVAWMTIVSARRANIDLNLGASSDIS
jgi:uncharacterized membrane protein YoaK (UPF0700 family)